MTVLPFPPQSGSPEAAGNTIEMQYPRENEGILYTPIRNEVPGIGIVDIVSESQFMSRRLGDMPRDDRFMRMELDGFGYGVHETLPDPNQDTGITLFYFPGFSEVIEIGSAKDMHDSLATHQPGLRIISVASDGIGATGERFGFKDAREHGVHEMGEARAKLMYALAGSEPIIVAGCSMGTVIGQHALEYDHLNGHNLNAYPLRYATAIVQPHLTPLYMGTLFPVSMLTDTPREVLRMAMKRDRSHLEDLSQMVKGRGEDLPALAIQMATLLGGVSMRSILRVSHNYHGGLTISGAFDPLKQTHMWATIRRRDDMTHIDTVPWRGHGMAADGEGGGQKITNDIQRWHILDEIQLELAA